MTKESTRKRLVTPLQRRSAKAERARADLAERELSLLRAEVDPMVFRQLHGMATAIRTIVADIEIAAGDRYPIALALAASTSAENSARIVRAEKETDERVRWLRRTGLIALRKLERELEVLEVAVQCPGERAKVRDLRACHGGG